MFRKKRLHVGYQSNSKEAITGKFDFKEMMRNEKIKQENIITEEFELIYEKTPEIINITPYLCTLHLMYFWRDDKTKKGQCGLCGIFSKGLHFSLYSEKYKKEVLGMTKVKRAISIEDGRYEGKIIDVEERTEPFAYIDFSIQFVIDGNKVKLKHGCPNSISIDDDNEPTTKLAKVLTALGMEIKIDKDITLTDMKDVSLGKDVSCMVENEETKAGTFARIISMKVVSKKK